MGQLDALGPAGGPRCKYDRRDGVGIVLRHLVRRWSDVGKFQGKRSDFRIRDPDRTEDMFDTGHAGTLAFDFLPLRMSADEQCAHAAAFGHVSHISSPVPMVQRHGHNPEARRSQVQGDPVSSAVRHDADPVPGFETERFKQKLSPTGLFVHRLPTVPEPFAQHMAVLDVGHRVRRGRDPFFEQLSQSVLVRNLAQDAHETVLRKCSESQPGPGANLGP